MSENEFTLYDRLEKDYWWFKARRNILSVFLSHIEKIEEKTILEIGCGTGGNLKYLFPYFLKRIGLEINETAIKYARGKMTDNTKIIRGDANDLGTVQERVNCVALLDVLYHKNIKSVNSVLVQVNKLLKKDGYLLISDGAFNFLEGSHSEYVDSARRFTIKELTSKLLKSNFRIIKASYWGFSLFFIIFLKRAIFERLFRKRISNKSNDLVSIPIIDSIFYFLVNSETIVLKKGDLPLGASLAILAQKTD